MLRIKSRKQYLRLKKYSSLSEKRPRTLIAVEMQGMMKMFISFVNVRTGYIRLLE